MRTGSSLLSSLEPGEPIPIQCAGRLLDGSRCVRRLRFARGARQSLSLELYYWHAPRSLYCDECSPAARAEQARIRLAARKAECGVPEDLRGYELSRILERKGRETWEHFEGRLRDCQQPTLAVDDWNRHLYQSLEACQLGCPSYWLWGHVGSGKSTFAAALVDKLLRLDLGLSVTWKVEAQLLDEIAGCYASERKELKRRVYESQVLVLDDMGASERFTDAEFDDVQDILTKFVESGSSRRKILVCTSNEALSSERITRRYGDRVMSRLLGLCGKKQWRLAGWDFRTGRDMRQAEKQAQLALVREKAGITGGDAGATPRAGRSGGPPDETGRS